MALNPKQFDPGENPDQLQLLMKPSEILSRLHGFYDDKDGDTWDDITPERYAKSGLHAFKLQEAESQGTADLIRKEGVLKPVVLMPPRARDILDPEKKELSRTRHFMLGNGHHRLAVAFDMEQQGSDIHIPVIHDNYIRADDRQEIERKGDPHALAEYDRNHGYIARKK